MEEKYEEAKIRRDLLYEKYTSRIKKRNSSSDKSFTESEIEEIMEIDEYVTNIIYQNNKWITNKNNTSLCILGATNNK